MNRLRKINLLCFLLLILVFVTFQYTVDLGDFSNRIKPWHMGKSDSLSVSYINKYEVLDQQRIGRKISDTSRTIVFVLVDAWGVPFEESLMEKDFEIFGGEKVKRILHKRMTEFTQYAEQVEYRLESQHGLYLFGGDSLEYDRLSYITELGYNSHVFCQKCSDEVMLNLVDSILQSPEVPSAISLTTQSSRGGDRDSLYTSLRIISNLIKNHPNVSFVIQGTHRPLLCSTKIRELYYQHWVPAVMVLAK